MECAVQWKRIIFIKMEKLVSKRFKAYHSMASNQLFTSISIFDCESSFGNVKVFGLVEWRWVDERGKKVGNYPYYMLYHNEANKRYHPF